jgi:hypothetical protein
MMGPPVHDPFAEMHRQHEKQFEDMLRENDRQMRQLEQQFRDQRPPGFEPGF